MCKLGRRQVAKPSVGAMGVVVTPPRFDDRLRVVERQELMDDEAFVAQAPVEGFDVPIVGGLSRPREVELHPAIERPGHDGFGREFCAMIDGDRFRQL